MRAAISTRTRLLSRGESGADWLSVPFASSYCPKSCFVACPDAKPVPTFGSTRLRLADDLLTLSALRSRKRCASPSNQTECCWAHSLNASFNLPSSSAEGRFAFCEPERAGRHHKTNVSLQFVFKGTMHVTEIGSPSDTNCAFDVTARGKLTLTWRCKKKQLFYSSTTC
jgi:hypothetical protein